MARPPGVPPLEGATFAVRRSEEQAQRRAREARPEPEWRPPGPGP